MSEFDAAAAAVQAALDAGARYADARVMHRRYESMTARNGDVEDLMPARGRRHRRARARRVRVGVLRRARPVRRRGARRPVHQATAIAAASATVVARRPRSSSPVRSASGSWASECEIDPLGVVAVRQGRPAGAGDGDDARARRRPRRGAVPDLGHGQVVRVQRGPPHRPARPRVRRRDHGDVDRRRRDAAALVPGGARASTARAGWELVDELDLEAHAARVAEEARALLSAPPCPSGETTLILGAEQLALQIHESVGHAIELDRILGWEAAYAGTSWLDLAQLGSLQYGSELMNITIDPTIPGALGSFGFDDEGTPAAPRDAVREGRWVGVLAGRDSAAVAGLDYAGSVRADGWARLPMVRMTNVGLEPGPHTLDEIIAATDDGIFMETNRSWSIDDRRLNFQFGCEVGYEVKNGELGRLLRNPTYTGIGPQFWRSMDMLSSETVAWGTPNCGKGQPGQIGHTGHPAAPARFRNVRVGVRA